MANPNNPRVDTGALKARLAALEQEALRAIDVSCDAFPRWKVAAEAYPYWINKVVRVSADTSPNDDGDEMAVYVYTLCGRLVVAQITADAAGGDDALVDAAIPQVISYVDERAWLQSASFPIAMPLLRECHFFDGVGYSVLPMSVAGVAQVGCELYWRATFDAQLEQVFLG